ncbi:hypothetical protein CVIRNUC_004740 [Coccomyxa viridis]|uniref:Uncharacterized protein n=1 Tax=Coccomyxa viridis TaxID=1274662 RepID=A0AAV1I666_9CHLO|nr:hypothetical protein CVIRNUC_004740 [Coccomyxa viridis]
MALVSFSVVVMAIAAAVASPLLFSSTRPSHVLSDKKTPFIGNGAQQSREPSNGAQLRLQHEDLSRINLLFVLDPNFFLCWETVLIDDSTKDTLLPWAASLKDVFTKSSESPAGLDLALPDRRHVARELRDIEEKTFRQLVGAYLERGSESISLPSNLLLMYMAVTSNCSLGELGLVDPSHAAAQTSLHLTPSRLHVTSEDNFWTAMLRVSSPESSYNDDPEEQTAKASDLLKHLDLKDTVIVLPRVVPQVNDLSPEDFRTDDPRDWNVTMLVGLVEGFLNRTGAATLPSLPEWTTLPDKRRLHDMYQSYYEADPKSRSPPIPTAFLRTPGSRTEQITLCRSGHFASSAAFIDAIMHAIYQGLLRLDAELTHQTSLGAKTERLAVTTEDEDDGTLRHFVIKREFAEGAIMMAMLKFPAAALPEPGQPAPMMYRGDAPWRTRPAIPEYMGEAVTRGGLVTTDPFLKEAAELVASRSCGEGWLLQPKISDMPEMEYRVYLLGGASSTGTAKDTVVIYTPALIDEGIYIANLTVPEGLFWSDIINPPGQEDVNFEGTGGIEYLPDKLNQDRQPWPNQPLHRLIVNAALSGARAMAAHEDGALSSVAHMYARMDVVLGVYWEGGRMFAQPLINEMDWFNSAGVMMRYWPVNSSTEALGEAHGPKLVGPFLREVARRYDASRK